MTKLNIKKMLVNLVPLLGLVVLYAVFMGLGTSKGINIEYGMTAILNQSVICAVVATGAIFIYTLGAFDISLGACTAVSAIGGAMVYNATESIPMMILACIGIAVVIQLFDSMLASVFHLPVFVTTIAMLSVLNAVVGLLIEINDDGDQVKVPSMAVMDMDTVEFKGMILVLFFIFSVFVFSFTKNGRKMKIQGSNPMCAKLSGIKGDKLAIISFVLAGIGVGLAAFLSIVYAPTLSRNSGSSVGMDVIIAIAFGGMPVSGGARSKIYAAVVGAFSMTFLSQIMTILNLNAGVGQMVKAIIFILVVFIATLNQRGKMLPR